MLANFPNSTVQQIDQCMGIVFKQAPDRSGGAGRKAAEEAGAMGGEDAAIEADTAADTGADESL